VLSASTPSWVRDSSTLVPAEPDRYLTLASMLRSAAMDWRERIVSDPAICHGKPTLKGTRVLVSVVLSHLAHGDRVEAIIEQFPSLSEDDVRAVIAFAAQAAPDDLPAPSPRVAGAGR